MRKLGVARGVPRVARGGAVGRGAPVTSARSAVNGDQDHMVGLPVGLPRAPALGRPGNLPSSRCGSGQQATSFAEPGQAEPALGRSCRRRQPPPARRFALVPAEGRAMRRSKCSGLFTEDVVLRLPGLATACGPLSPPPSPAAPPLPRQRPPAAAPPPDPADRQRAHACELCCCRPPPWQWSNTTQLWPPRS